MIFLLALLSWIQSHSDSAVKCVFNVLLAKLWRLIYQSSCYTAESWPAVTGHRCIRRSIRSLLEMRHWVSVGLPVEK